MRRFPAPQRRNTALLVCLCFLLADPSTLFVSSFVQSPVVSSPRTSEVRPTIFQENTYLANNRAQSTTGSSTSLNSFMGSDGGLLGIGTPELFTILLVGYFVLGPSDLYKLVKEIGKFVQNVRTLGSEATQTFESSMENTIELQEIRKAQAELNDAFSFRRSINDVPGPTDSVIREVAPPAAAAAAAATADAVAEPSQRKKKKRRRVKKKQPEPEPDFAGMESSAGTFAGNVPDLDMSDSFPSTNNKDTSSSSSSAKGDDWFADGFPSASDMAKEDIAWLSEGLDEEDSNTTTTASKPPVIAPKDPAVASAEQSRFQQQLSGSWNDKVLDNEDQLAPLAVVMEKLAILEEEKQMAEKRLEDEFRQRFQLEEDFYRKKRELLEEAAVKVQEDAYVTMDSGTTSSSTKK